MRLGRHKRLDPEKTYTFTGKALAVIVETILREDYMPFVKQDLKATVADEVTRQLSERADR